MGFFKLGKMTFGSLFKKPETVLYPIETKPQPAGLKGHIAIDVETCILCGMCERSCSTDCITVNKQDHYWEIDRFQCVQCGYCITVCPKKCLSMDPNYAPASTVHKADRFDVPIQDAAPAKKASEKAPEKADAPQPAAASAEDAEKTSSTVDSALEGKIALMDPEKAERVRAALAARNG